MIEELRIEIIKAVEKIGEIAPADFDLLEPENVEFGHLSTNIALLIAGRKKENPKNLAEKIIENLDKKYIEKIEIKAPGFINLFLNDLALNKIVSDVLKADGDYGRSKIGDGKKVLLEFVSANPTGPLHIGNARGGPIGQTLNNIFNWLGYKSETEFYVNDTGGQIKKFGATLAYWYISKNDPSYNFPEGGYPGEFLKEISEKIAEEFKSEISELKDYELEEFFIRNGLDLLIRRIKNDLDLLGIKFDQFVYESDFTSSGKTQQVVDKLVADEKTETREGAVWLKTVEKDDEDSVLVKSDADKTLTYFASDIAYHKDKFDRGFDKFVDIWGANHHGHISRLKSALRDLGYDDEKLDIILYQIVRLRQGGVSKQMGKRLGNFVNLETLVNELKVPGDVFKYTILSYSANSTIDFDLDLALTESEKNPVFYVKYAHARIWSILKKAEKDLVKEAENGEIKIDFKNDKEKYLALELAKLPELLISISQNYQTQSLPNYCQNLARKFHDFYASCRVISKDKKETGQKLALVIATRNVLKIALTLMSIDAPEKM